MTEQDYTEEDEQLYRPVYTAVENVIVSDFGIGAVGLSDEVTEAVLTVVIGWLAERDRQVAQRAWGEGFEAGWAECNDPGPFVNDVWDAKTPNPYRKEATGD